LVNLLDNAWKYSPAESGSRYACRRVKGACASMVKTVALKSPPRETRKIFRKFYQADQALSRFCRAVRDRGLDFLILMLTAKEFRLLAYFLERLGRALTREDILNSVWGHSIVVTERVDRCVTNLAS
jgi:DNA-binding response OmpR family regulator